MRRCYLSITLTCFSLSITYAADLLEEDVSETNSQYASDHHSEGSDDLLSPPVDQGTQTDHDHMALPFSFKDKLKMAETLYRSGFKSQALDVLSQCENKDPTPHCTLSKTDLAVTLVNLGEVDTARQLCRKIIAHPNPYIPNLITVGKIFYYIGDTHDAVTQLHNCIKHPKADFTDMLTAIDCFDAFGDPDTAKALRKELTGHEDFPTHLSEWLDSVIYASHDASPTTLKTVETYATHPNSTPALLLVIFSKTRHRYPAVSDTAATAAIKHIMAAPNHITRIIHNPVLFGNFIGTLWQLFHRGHSDLTRQILELLPVSEIPNVVLLYMNTFKDILSLCEKVAPHLKKNFYTKILDFSDEELEDLRIFHDIMNDFWTASEADPLLSLAERQIKVAKGYSTPAEELTPELLQEAEEFWKNIELKCEQKKQELLGA